MRIFLGILFFTAMAIPNAEAHVPYLISQTSLHDITQIEDPHISKAYYGTLEGFPHTYEIISTEPFLLFAEILIPDIHESEPIVSGIVIREVGTSGRVSEVDRLLATESEWNSFYEPFGGDSYRRGASILKEVEAGIYRIEVTTPNNDEKYVLVVGKEEKFGEIGYFETLKRMIEVKAFFGKSKLRIVESPFVYIPLVILCIGLLVWNYKRRHRIQSKPAHD